MSQYGRGYFTASSSSSSQFHQQPKPLPNFPQDDDFEYDHGSSFNQNSKRPSPWSNNESEIHKRLKSDRNDYFDSNNSNHNDYHGRHVERNYNSNIIADGNVSVNGNYGSYRQVKDVPFQQGYSSSKTAFDEFQEIRNESKNPYNNSNYNGQMHFKHGPQEYNRNDRFSDNSSKNNFAKMSRSTNDRFNGGNNKGFCDKDYSPPVVKSDFNQFNRQNSGNWNHNHQNLERNEKFSPFNSSNAASPFQYSFNRDRSSGNFSELQRQNSIVGSPSGSVDQHNTVQQQNQPTPGALAPELSMPVFQTLDRTDSWTTTMVRHSFKRNSSSLDKITAKSEKAEEWAWSSGKKWNVPNPAKPKLNLYAAAPKVEQIHAAPRVSGGIGEKLLQKMGWNKGEGLGKTGDGEVNPIGFNEIKTDRKGLQDGQEKSGASEVNSAEKMQSKFQEMKSKSFWSWHSGGMKGPEDFRERIKVAKKEAKVAKQKIQETATVDVSDKHPVSALMELCQKRGWQEPRFSEERGQKGFRFTVKIQDQSYQPPAYCDNKKLAKKECAHHCLVTMGLIAS